VWRPYSLFVDPFEGSVVGVLSLVESSFGTTTQRSKLFQCNRFISWRCLLRQKLTDGRPGPESVHSTTLATLAEQKRYQAGPTILFDRPRRCRRSVPGRARGVQSRDSRFGKRKDRDR
jgi:hypothetical protein